MLLKAQRLEAFKQCDWLQNQIDEFHYHTVAYWIKDIALEEEFTYDILDAFDDAGLDKDKDENIVTIPTLMSSPDDAENTDLFALSIQRWYTGRFIYV